MLVIEQDEFRRLMSLRPALAETIFSALVARREILRSGAGCSGDQDHRLALLARGDEPALVCRALADPAHTWIDLEQADDVDTLLVKHGSQLTGHPRGDHPRGDAAARHAATFAEQLGLTFQPVPGFIFDLIVVGSGPAGLAAAVYGASEGLSTVCLDSVTGRWSGRVELADRELRGIPQRHLRRRPRRPRCRAGDATWGAAELAVRGRRPARRRKLPRSRRCATAARSPPGR